MKLPDRRGGASAAQAFTLLSRARPRQVESPGKAACSANTGVLWPESRGVRVQATVSPPSKVRKAPPPCPTTSESASASSEHCSPPTQGHHPRIPPRRHPEEMRRPSMLWKNEKKFLPSKPKCLGSACVDGKLPRVGGSVLLCLYQLTGTRHPV